MILLLSKPPSIFEGAALLDTVTLLNLCTHTPLQKVMKVFRLCERRRKAYR